MIEGLFILKNKMIKQFPEIPLAASVFSLLQVL